MKYLCEGCEQLVELVQYRFEARTVVARCEECDQATRSQPAERAVEVRVFASPSSVRATAPVPLRAELPKVIPLRPLHGTGMKRGFALADGGRLLAVPPGFCPRCISAWRPNARACDSCGLIDPSSFDARALELSAAVIPQWLATLEDWEQPSRHEAMRVQAGHLGELAALGRQYRIRLAQWPEDAPAQQGRDEVLRMASTLPALRAPVTVQRSKSVTGWRVATLVALVALGAGVLFWFLGLGVNPFSR